MLYSDDFLIDRIFDKLEGKFQKKFTMAKPKVERKNRKTFISNFGDLCITMNRDEKMVRDFFEKQLEKSQSDITISTGSLLSITGSYSQIDIEKVFKDFTKKYVICMESKCNSGITELIKENKITYILCKTCNCKMAIK